MRVVSTEVLLLGGVGYTYLGDMSFGAILVERLRALEWSSGVAVEDVSYNPITVMDWLRDDPDRFDRAIFFGAIERGREPGSLTRYRWIASGIPAATVQDCVAEAVTGSISLYNLLVIGSHFELLPADTTVIEFEPVENNWGQGLSATGEMRATEVIGWLRGESTAPATVGANGHGAQA